MENNLEYWLAELTSGEDERAEAAVAALKEHGEEAVEGLLPLLSDPRPDARWWGLHALAEIPDRRAPPLLAEAVKDPDLSVRQCAALALRRQPAPEAVPALIGALADEDRLFARLAGDALAAVGPAATAPLAKVLQDLDQPQQVRLEAARALALIGDTAAIPALFSVLEDESMWIQHWANEGLDRLGVGMSFFKP
jgi:HEAT repeat protein